MKLLTKRTEMSFFCYENIVDIIDKITILNADIKFEYVIIAGGTVEIENMNLGE